MALKMQQVDGLWLPAYEKHLLEWRLEAKTPLYDYQRPQCDHAWKYVKNWRTAIDAGGHVGIFSLRMAWRFQRVLAYEPVDDLRECWVKNLKAAAPLPAKVLSVSDLLLGDRMQDEVPFRALNTSATGGSYAMIEGVTPLAGTDGDFVTRRMITVDSLDLHDLDLIKIDTQGCEPHVLRGGLKTFQRCRTTLIVEEKPAGGPTGSTAHIAEIQKIMLKAGALDRGKVGADRVYSFE